MLILNISEARAIFYYFVSVKTLNMSSEKLTFLMKPKPNSSANHIIQVSYDPNRHKEDLNKTHMTSFSFFSLVFFQPWRFFWRLSIRRLDDFRFIMSWGIPQRKNSLFLKHHFRKALIRNLIISKHIKIKIFFEVLNEN